MKNTDLFNLFELSPVPIWIFDVSTYKFLDVNKAAIEQYGYSKDEFLSMTIHQIRPPEDIERIEGIIKENVETGIFYTNTFRHILKNGEIINVEIASNLINFEGKEARVVLAIDISEILHAQEALKMSEERFKALVRDGSDLITVIDRDFNYKYVSPASKRVFGVEPDFFIGKNAFAYIHPDDLALVEKEAIQIWEYKHIQLSPYRYRDLNGNWLWIETRATNLYHEPAIQGIVCTSKDITERIKNDRIVQENIERYNIVSKATSDIIWDCNFVNDTIAWNKAINGVLKYKNKEHTTYKWWLEQIHEEDKERVLAKLERCIASGSTKWEDEYRFRCGDGSYKYIFDRGFVLLDEKGKAYRMIGAMQDITARKEEEAWSEVLESVVVNATDAILITNAAEQPVIIYVNDALVEMSGYSREELIGQFPDILHNKHSDQRALNKLKQAIKDQKPCAVELVNYTKQGQSYHVSVTLNPIFEGDGKLARWVSIRRDVSEYWRHMDEIEEQNRKLNEISWMQSHVARAPLARILSLVELLAHSKDEQERLELMKYLKSSADELDQIITTIANQT
ncbi:PAS domain S-box protein [Pedobacter polaris]|uniref:histidine kinase n=1 Tax=Pedobacter polaris TaxID=2571273 RepID=A0A4U1CQM8_9SPHI|nr:PAS domain-containing protein [Pedobacter polaris]TKC10417.1 PAS domain S-box protein [Pedobacter polaris]